MPNFEYAEFAEKFPKTAALFSEALEDPSSTVVMVLPTYDDQGVRLQPLVISGDKEEPWKPGVQRMTVQFDATHSEFAALTSTHSPN